MFLIFPMVYRGVSLSIEDFPIDFPAFGDGYQLPGPAPGGGVAAAGL